MMNYVDADQEDGRSISRSRLFWLSITNFHHLLQFSHRFDPTFSRLDRFLVYFLQLSMVTFGSFVLLRDIDGGDTGANKYDEAVHGAHGGAAHATSGTAKQSETSLGDLFSDPRRLILLLGCLLIFSLLLQPAPNWSTALLRRKYILQESEEVDEGEDEDELDKDPAGTALSKTAASINQSINQDDS